MNEQAMPSCTSREALNNKAGNVCFVLVWIELVFISDGLCFVKYFKKKGAGSVSDMFLFKYIHI